MRYACLIWFSIVVCVSGCSKLPHPSRHAVVPDSPEVTGTLMHLGQTNSGLSTFKGTGKIKLWNKDSTQVFRAAWTGARPDKIRIVIQGVTGFPVASMAVDGNWFYLLSYSQDSFYKTEIQNPDLEKLVALPVTASDIIRFLSGTVPVRPYISSILTPSPTGDSHVLSLLGEDDAPVEIIYLDQDRIRVHRVEMFSSRGRLAYRVDLSGETDVDGFQVPAILNFSNDNGPGFRLDMDRFWPNAPVSPDMFVISP